MRSRYILKTAVALLLAMPCAVGVAMTLERAGGDLFATGSIEDGDLRAFKQAFAEGGIERVVLVNSSGGDLWTAMQVASMIQSAGVQTLASGQCMSACSLMFIAGKERFFATGNRPRYTMIGIHGAHDGENGRVDPAWMPQMYALYKSQIGARFDEALMNQALYGMKHAGGMLRIRELQRTSEAERAPWFCPKADTPPFQCQRYPGKDAYSLGIVTGPGTVAITLPRSMQPVLTFFGRQLPEPETDLQGRAAELIDAVCPYFACKLFARDLVDNWLQADTHRAFAIGVDKIGYGNAWGADDTWPAMASALYRCNHARANKKLCKLVAVDEQETYSFYDAVEQQSKAALADLPVPPPGASERERAEPGVASPASYRTEDLEQVTPQEVHGVRRVDTSELAALLKSDAPPALIDVIAAIPVMLPSAIHFVGGGMAFADPAADDAYDERFRDMLRVAVPDKAAPVVFYCVDSQSWHSVNAAMRAVRAGYTNVMWYRGGIAAWQAAGLPTTGKVPLAVLLR